MKQNSKSWLISSTTFLLCDNKDLVQGSMSKIDWNSIFEA